MYHLEDATGSSPRCSFLQSPSSIGHSQVMFDGQDRFVGLGKNSIYDTTLESKLHQHPSLLLSIDGKRGLSFHWLHRQADQGYRLECRSLADGRVLGTVDLDQWLPDEMWVSTPKACLSDPKLNRLVLQLEDQLLLINLNDEVPWTEAAPSMNFDAPRQLKIGEPWTGHLSAGLPESTVSLKERPEGLTQQGNDLRWTPGKEDVGTHTISILHTHGDQTEERTFSLQVWPAPPRRIPLVFPVQRMALRADGKRMAVWQVSEGGKSAGEIGLIDTDSGKLLAVKHYTPNIAAALLTDDAVFLTTKDGMLGRCAPDSLEPEENTRLPGPGNAMAWEGGRLHVEGHKFLNSYQASGLAYTSWGPKSLHQTGPILVDLGADGTAFSRSRLGPDGRGILALGSQRIIGGQYQKRPMPMRWNRPMPKLARPYTLQQAMATDRPLMARIVWALPPSGKGRSPWGQDRPQVTHHQLIVDSLADGKTLINMPLESDLTGPLAIHGNRAYIGAGTELAIVDLDFGDQTVAEPFRIRCPKLPTPLLPETVSEIAFETVGGNGAITYELAMPFPGTSLNATTGVLRVEGEMIEQLRTKVVNEKGQVHPSHYWLRHPQRFDETLQQIEPGYTQVYGPLPGDKFPVLIPLTVIATAADGDETSLDFDLPLLVSRAPLQASQDAMKAQKALQLQQSADARKRAAEERQKGYLPKMIQTARDSALRQEELLRLLDELEARR